MFVLFIYEEFPSEYIDICVRETTDFPSHFHNCLEIIYILEGSQRLLVDNKEYDIYEDDLLIVFPYQLHGFIESQNKSILFIVETSILKDFTDTFKRFIPETPIIRGPQLPENFKEKILNLYAIREQHSAFNKSIIKGSLMIITGEILNSIKLTEKDDNNDSLMRRTINYIQQNYKSSDITLKSMADDLKISQYYLSRFLSNKLHISFNSYINYLRIDYACNKLVTDNISITELAYSCGYNNIRTFNRAFKRLKGKNPTEYKAEFLNSEQDRYIFK